MLRPQIWFAIAFCWLLPVAGAHAQVWGDLKGQFVIAGEPPAAGTLPVPAGAGCGPAPVPNEQIIVGPGGELQNVVVWLRPAADVKVSVHPAYAALAKVPAVFNNLACRFEPHVGTIWTEQTLEVRNGDAIGHAFAVAPLETPPIALALAPGAKLNHTFKVAENLPSPISCGIHPWMKGWLLIKDHPYMAVTDAKGNFVIKDLPAGTWTFQVWHEKLGYVRKVNIGGKPVEWKFGRFPATINAKGVDLGKVTVSIQ